MFTTGERKRERSPSAEQGTPAPTRQRQSHAAAAPEETAESSSSPSSPIAAAAAATAATAATATTTTATAAAAAAAAAARGAEAGNAARPRCQSRQLRDNTGSLRHWPRLLTAADQKRLFEEISRGPAFLPAPKTKNAAGDGGGGGSQAEAGADETGRWVQRPIKLLGKEVLQPRLTCFYGQKGLSYSYSGKRLEATPWDGVPAIQEILAAAEAAAGLGPGFFNCVLLNWYRDGSDYIGWHSDDEKELEKGAGIASVSLGEGRQFQLRRTSDNSQKLEYLLSGGSLLVMEGNTQDHWQHRVPKRGAKEERKIKQVAGQTKLCWGKPSASESRQQATGAAAGEGGGRINLTFRRISAKPRSRA